MTDTGPDLPRITVLPGKHKRAKSGHPWIYANEVDMNPARHAVLERAIGEMAQYVLSLSGRDHDAAAAARAAPKYAQVCAACHMADGTGMQAVGAPNLTDDTWLYGGSINSITNAINNGLNNAMPAFGQRLDEGKIRVLAAYVWSLSHAENAQ